MKHLFFVAIALISFVSCSEAQEKTNTDDIINKVVDAEEFNTVRFTVIIESHLSAFTIVSWYVLETVHM